MELTDDGSVNGTQSGASFIFADHNGVARLGPLKSQCSNGVLHQF